MIHMLLNDTAMTNSQIREIDCKCLNDYLATIPQSNHRFFVKKVVAECGNGIKQKTFYNWKAGYCRIPDFRKDIIEKIAGCKVISPRALFGKQARQHNIGYPADGNGSRYLAGMTCVLKTS